MYNFKDNPHAVFFRNGFAVESQSLEKMIDRFKALMDKKDFSEAKKIAERAVIDYYAPGLIILADWFLTLAQHQEDEGESYEQNYQKYYEYVILAQKLSERHPEQAKLLIDLYKKELPDFFELKLSAILKKLNVIDQDRAKVTVGQLIEKMEKSQKLQNSI